MKIFFSKTLFPLLLILLCPPFIMLFWYTNTVLQGSLGDLINLISDKGIVSTLEVAWLPYWLGSATAWKILVVFTITQLLIMLYVPGKKFYGELTTKGNIPEYKANGVLAFIITFTLFCLASFTFKLFPASILYDNLGYLLGALNTISLFICLLLYFKGRYFPSSTDSGITGNFIFDYYWGTELYPMAGRLSIKKFITCRFGMMSWGLLLISYAAKQSQLYGLSNSMIVSVGLQLIYLAKFYTWETGYLRSLDIMHDRAGFYICWGCLVWVPSVYTSCSLYLVHHPINLPTSIAAFIFVCGVLAIACNYLADRQRQLVRATNGNCLIWGKKPKLIMAKYATSTGETKESILLVSGWWGVARHFHYLPELAATFLWSVPALFFSILPYFYFFFLTVLLVHRSFRDELRCHDKYGKYWEQYRKLVPYRLIPNIL